MNARHGRRARVLAAFVVVLAAACGHRGEATMITFAELAAKPIAPADARIVYGEGPLQFGELRLPNGTGPFPLVVLVHGGCWQAAYDLGHVSQAAAALTREGFATWTIEYRRIGDAGGGWPGTFEDVARATAYVATIAQRYPVDTHRVILAGHSAGGHLALWAARRDRTPIGDAPALPGAVTIRGVVSLAGISDLRAYGAAPGGCNESVAPLLGGSPAAVPARYAAASPAERLPLGVPSRLVHGALDPIVPVAQSRSFAELARASGDDAELILVPGAGHFDLVAPGSAAWPSVVAAVHALSRAR